MTITEKIIDLLAVHYARPSTFVRSLVDRNEGSIDETISMLDGIVGRDDGEIDILSDCHILLPRKEK